MNILRILAGVGVTLMVCLTASAVDAQPKEATQGARPRPGIGAAPPRSSLTVQKILVPSNDPGTFNLIIDGNVVASQVGNNGTSGPIAVTAGAHSVTETAVSISLLSYTTVVGGDCSPSGVVAIAAGQNKTCTLTSTRKHLNGLTEPVHLDGAAIQVWPDWTPGSWTQGPGAYTFSVCAYGATCNINGGPGQSIPITIETWGGGGGGGGGRPAESWYSGEGGGGGGGGGYGKTTVTALVPSSGSLLYYVKVGAGGVKGQTAGAVSVQGGGDGGLTEVRLNSAAGALVLKATGGLGGGSEEAFPNCGDANGGAACGGASGSGTINSWAGLAGGVGGHGTACNGFAGGMGGPGGGPGRTGPGYVNDGGNGGHGGYFHSVVFPTCTAHGTDYELSAGDLGGNGKVRFGW